MGWLARTVGKLFGAPPPAPTHPATTPTRRPVSRYDSAQTTDENRNHWAAADSLSASAANSADVRAKLRQRSRYEKANNGYAKGVIRGRTNDTIGTGPRLQLELPETDPDFARPISPEAAEALTREVERLWCEWALRVGLVDKLRVMAEAEDTDGETFALFTSDDKSTPGVRLNLRVIECDRVTTLAPALEQEVDGIELDRAGRPVAYHVLRQHPGSNVFTAGFDFDRVPAAQVVHLFDADRPEQYRGIPILTPALPLYAILRRFTLAELGAAEVGAMIAGVIENPNAPMDPSGADAPEFEAMDKIPFARNALLTLAGGQTAKAFDTKNPNPNSDQFKKSVLTEAGRSAGESQNTATGSSSDYNYSSGRLDHMPRQRGLLCRRDRWERNFLDRLVMLWAEEAALAGVLPEGLPPVESWQWRWHWDGFESIDPFKDASAVKVLKELGLTTDADELAKRGKDWREHYRQLAREKQLREELGIEPAPKPAPAFGTPVPADAAPADGQDGQPPDGEGA